MVSELTDSGGFPLVNNNNTTITSSLTDRYNCIAWAAKDESNWWWPQPITKKNFWPAGLPRSTTVNSFVIAFQSLGYEQCTSGDLEVGFEKVALYVDSASVPTHMSRQLDSGLWTSKMGEWHDISHETPETLTGDVYGSVHLFMKRSIAAN
ncbi:MULTISPECIES: hypothetical protein [unclassified Duganella]|uniref:DUF7689 domain-containing protein n=1 Tax=unclassified Duganella TaxID=2636909 RepID=UPI0011C12E12|nr:MULTISPECIES: hypothetical protein [unclassified Duganella]